MTLLIKTRAAVAAGAVLAGRAPQAVTFKVPGPENE